MVLRRGAAAGLLVLAFGLGVAWNLGGPPVAHIMEIRNLVTAREMVDTGHWWLPTMNGVPRLAKPPLPTWMAAMGALVGGGFRDLAAMRAPTVLCALLGAMGAAAYVRRLRLGAGAGLLTALILPTLFLYAHEARLATWDIPAHACAMAGIAVLVAGRDAERTWAAGLAGVLFAASMLSKGPVALGVLVAPWIVATAFWRREDLRIGWAALTLVAAVSLGLGLSWPIHASLHTPEVASATLWREIGTWVSRHVRPPWFYATGGLMTGFWLPTAVVTLSIPWSAPRLAARREVRLLLGWTLITLVLLALIPMKKDRYLVPALYPWSMLLAAWWASPQHRGPRVSRVVARAQIGWVLALLTAAVVALTMLRSRLGLGEDDARVALTFILVGWACVVAIAGRRGWDLERRAVLGTLAASIAVAAAGWQIQASVDVPHVRRASYADIGRRDGRLRLPAFSTDARDLSLVWDIGRPLRSAPGSAADLEGTMRDLGKSAPWRVVWLATAAPRLDGELARIASSGATIEVESQETFTRATEAGGVEYWLSVLTVRPRRASP